MKKYSRIIALLLSVVLILPGAGLVTKAEETSVVRLAGENRIETAVAVSKEAYTTSDVVVLAGHVAEPDSLTGTLLAAEKNAPLLLTHKGGLTKATKDEITRLGATKVFILGGDAAVTAAVHVELEDMGLAVERVAGETRYETAAKVAEEVAKTTTSTHAFIVRGLDTRANASLADALAVGPVSATKKDPVLLVNQNELREETKTALTDLGITHVTIVGGTSAVSAKVATDLVAAGVTVTQRVFGDTRDETALAIAAEYFADATTAVVANRLKAADALVGGYFAAMHKAPILLTAATTPSADTLAFLEENTTEAFVLGGETVVTAAAFTKIADAVDFTEDLKVVSVSAINAKTIEVKFSQPVNDGTGANEALAINGANDVYSVIGATLTGATAKISDDNKTVTITLATPIVNDTNVAFTVAPIKSETDPTVLTDVYTTTFKFVDNVKPTYVDFENDAVGVVKVNFSEALNQTKITTANVTVTKADGTAVALKDDGSATAGTELDIQKTDNGFKLLKLEDKVEYNVSVKNFEDLVGNLTSPNIVNFTVKSTAELDAVAPKVTNIVAKGLTHVVVSIDKEPFDISVTPGTTPAKYVVLTGTGITEKKTSAQVYDKKAGTVTIELDTTLPSNGDIISIKADGFKNLDGKAGTAFTKLVAFSTTTKLVKSEVVAVPTTLDPAITEDFIKVTFDKEIGFTTPSGAVTATLLTKDNLETSVSIPAANFAKGTKADELNILYIKVEGVTDLEEGKLTIPVTNSVVTTLTADAKAIVDYVPLSTDASNPKVDTSKGGGNGITVVKNIVTVEYTQDMGQSALDLNNYTVAGAKVFEKAIFKGNKKTVELTVKPNAISDTAVYDVKIAKAVANDKGITLKTDYVTTQEFVETIQPELKKAILVEANKITLTFSENVTVSANGFDVFVDGEKVATTSSLGSAALTLDIAITTPLTADQITKPITVKLAKDAVVKDANDNILKDFVSLPVTE